MRYEDIVLKAFSEELEKLAAAVPTNGMFAKLWKNRREGLLVGGGAAAYGIGQDTLKKYKLGSDMMRAQREAEKQMG